MGAKSKLRLRTLNLPGILKLINMNWLRIARPHRGLDTYILNFNTFTVREVSSWNLKISSSERLILVLLSTAVPHIGLPRWHSREESA